MGWRASVTDDGSYRVATAGYLAEFDDRIGEPERVERSGLDLRTAFEAYFRRHGLSRLA